MRRLLACSAGLFWLCSSLWGLEVPYLAGRVNDLAGLLSEHERQQLEERLAQLEQATGAQMAVLTLPSLEGENLEEYSYRVASTWQLGQKHKDNGVLFLIARDDRKMRLEVGYGLEAVLPDLTCRRILDNLVRPRFRAGDFDGGTSAGVDAVAKLIEGEAQPEAIAEGKEVGNAFPPWALIPVGLLFLYTVVFGSLTVALSTGCASWFMYFALLPFMLVFPGVFLHPRVGQVSGLAWLLLVPVLKFVVHRTAWAKNFRERHPGLFQVFRLRPRPGGIRVSLSFSGRGGSFGGGGASSSW